MGCSSSKVQQYAAESGTEADYKATFEEQKKLGEGEFGVVKLVVKKSDPDAEPYAVKILNKGVVFKDNTLYLPMKPETLKMEIHILRKLNGKYFNLVLDSTYESSSKVYIVSEICSGGEMLEYTSKNKAEGLRTEDVSRIAYQLLSAVDHCDRHNILHRDIKPENIMFKGSGGEAELRLIDFGCATMDEEKGKEHVTFAGTAFYISPEMFQKKYTTKTDVFSVGVVLYVLVAGYPAACLQAAFNLLQKANRDLKTLPGMPEDMPDTYYDMLDKLLVYRWKGRKSASEMLDDEFVKFHQALEESTMERRPFLRTQSTLLSGTGEKAAAAFDFTKFQRAVTTILATMMDRDDIHSVVSFASAYEMPVNKLGVIQVNNLKSILKDMGKLDCVAAIDKQKNAKLYGSYSYDYTVLNHFVEKIEAKFTSDADASTRSLKSAMILKSMKAFDVPDMLSASEAAPRRRVRKAHSVAIRA
ncbi:hypothetical protein ACHAWF_011766 [Thalassiosira exigua]